MNVNHIDALVAKKPSQPEHMADRKRRLRPKGTLEVFTAGGDQFRHHAAAGGNDERAMARLDQGFGDFQNAAFDTATVKCRKNLENSEATIGHVRSA